MTPQRQPGEIREWIGTLQENGRDDIDGDNHHEVDDHDSEEGEYDDEEEYNDGDDYEQPYEEEGYTDKEPSSSSPQENPPAPPPTPNPQPPNPTSEKGPDDSDEFSLRAPPGLSKAELEQYAAVKFAELEEKAKYMDPEQVDRLIIALKREEEKLEALHAPSPAEVEATGHPSGDAGSPSEDAGPSKGSIYEREVLNQAQRILNGQGGVRTRQEVPTQEELRREKERLEGEISEAEARLAEGRQAEARQAREQARRENATRERLARETESARRKALLRQRAQREEALLRERREEALRREQAEILQREQARQAAVDEILNNRLNEVQARLEAKRLTRSGITAEVKAAREEELEMKYTQLYNRACRVKTRGPTRFRLPASQDREERVGWVWTSPDGGSSGVNNLPRPPVRRVDLLLEQSTGRKASCDRPVAFWRAMPSLNGKCEARVQAFRTRQQAQVEKRRRWVDVEMERDGLRKPSGPAAGRSGLAARLRWQIGF